MNLDNADLRVVDGERPVGGVRDEEEQADER